jgi:Zn-dependent M28 family amino/carboxypeptidase
MMHKLLSALLFIFTLSACIVQKNPQVNQKDVERIIRTLAADDMQGRKIFSPGIERAATFIEKEFQEIGLQPLSGQSSFRQDFSKTMVKPQVVTAIVNGKNVEPDKIFAITDAAELSWTSTQNAELHTIASEQSFMQRYKEIMALKKPVVVFVDEALFDAFNKARDFFMRERVINTVSGDQAVFILGEEKSDSFHISIKNNKTAAPLFNVAGILPGKSKPNEYVIFSGHYDHLGIIETSKGDSIANGADDDASGVTAVISLARYFKKLGNNERTLIFVAFTGEEAGMLGSKHFAGRVNPAEIVAMFNIEMIGKESKFGKNAAFITGFDRSDFGSILQKNLTGTGFTFHPDPYPHLDLFYRSDNATLAALGVPAHTISTDQIDKDKFYHTVDDEIETLDVNNIVATIKAIALSSKGIVTGDDTPKRVPLLDGKP